MHSPWWQPLLKWCPQAGHADACRLRLRMTPAVLAARLPVLGSVLYMPLAACGAGMPSWPCRLLVATPELAPLLHVHWLLAVSEIAPDGPREWVDGIDREGRPCLRLHLLPDTDYLGWDRLLACGEPAPALPAPPHLRALGAQPLRFHRQRLAGLDLLHGEPVARLSPLGRQLAGRIVRAQAG